MYVFLQPPLSSEACMESYICLYHSSLKVNCTSSPEVTKDFSKKSQIYFLKTKLKLSFLDKVALADKKKYKHKYLCFKIKCRNAVSIFIVKCALHIYKVNTDLG